MMTGRPLPDYNIIALEFGTFVHISEDNNSINTTKPRTTPSIALNQTSNTQVYYCLSLVICFILDRQTWDIIPIPTHVVQAVETMVERQEQPIMRNGEMVF